MLLFLQMVEKRGCKYFEWVDEPFDSRVSGVLSFLINGKIVAEERAVKLDAKVKELSIDLENMIDANESLYVLQKNSEEKILILETEKEVIEKKMKFMVKAIGLLCLVIIWLVLINVM